MVASIVAAKNSARIPQVRYKIKSFHLLTGIIDRSRLVCVSATEDLDQLLSVLTFTETVLKFLQTDGTVAITIKSLEDRFELLDIVRVGLNSDRHQGNLLDLFRLLELLEVTDVQAVYSGLSL